MSRRVLVLGATGTLGNPVASCLAERGHTVRVLARNAKKASRILGSAVEVVEGSSTDKGRKRKAMAGCDAVHVSLPTEAELIAVQLVIEQAAAQILDRVSYVSGTSVREKNRWFEMIDVQVRAEDPLRRSGIPHPVFCPTCAMETLHRFVQGDRATVISGKTPPGLHFFAAANFGRMVATAYEADGGIGKRLYIHGPESITLPTALRTFLAACHPQVKVIHLKLWQARLIGTLRRRMDSASQLIGYFDKVGELGDPAAAEALLGAPSTTLSEWIERRTPVRPREGATST